MPRPDNSWQQRLTGNCRWAGAIGADSQHNDESVLMAKSVVGPWAAEKLSHLRKYLAAYTAIMRNQKWCAGYHYIDAFAGPGEHEIRKAKPSKVNDVQQALIDVARFASEQKEQQRFLAGSPQIALEVEPPFTTYVFIERSPERVAALEILKTKHEGLRKIAIRKADCRSYLHTRVANNPRIDWKKERAIVFLDPFGMQVNWETIVELASTRAIDVFLNFPVGMAIQRLLPRRAEDLTSVRRQYLDNYFGATDWQQVFYRKQPSLFGDDDQGKIEHSGKTILMWYRKRLLSVFAHVSDAALFRNTRGAHLYYLLLASHNKTGVKIANEILSAGELVT